MKNYTLLNFVLSHKEFDKRIYMENPYRLLMICEDEDLTIVNESRKVFDLFDNEPYANSMLQCTSNSDISSELALDLYNRGLTLETLLENKDKLLNEFNEKFIPFNDDGFMMLMKGILSEELYNELEDEYRWYSENYCPNTKKGIALDGYKVLYFLGKL